jgi:hypothetical protein
MELIPVEDLQTLMVDERRRSPIVDQGGESKPSTLIGGAYGFIQTRVHPRVDGVLAIRSSLDQANLNRSSSSAHLKGWKVPQSMKWNWRKEGMVCLNKGIEFLNYDFGGTHDPS